MSQYVITEGSSFVHNEREYKLITRTSETAIVENGQGQRTTLTKNVCPVAFQQLLNS